MTETIHREPGQKYVEEVIVRAPFRVEIAFVTDTDKPSNLSSRVLLRIPLEVDVKCLRRLVEKRDSSIVLLTYYAETPSARLYTVQGSANRGFIDIDALRMDIRRALTVLEAIDSGSDALLNLL